MMFDLWPVYSGERFRASWLSYLVIFYCSFTANLQIINVFYLLCYMWIIFPTAIESWIYPSEASVAGVSRSNA